MLAQLQPVITIVIPTYNRLPLLKKAIASVREQTYDNWELFIVDDGSEDGTQEMIRQLKDSRITLIESVNKGNIAALRNEGVQAGQGEYIAFLDSDDFWLPYKLEIQLAVMCLEKKRWSYTCYELMDEAETTIPHRTNLFRPLSGWVTDEVLQTKTDITICSVMLERSLFNQVGGFNTDPQLLHRTDFDLIIRLSIAEPVIAISALLLRVREHAGRSTKSFQDGHQRSAYAFANFLQSGPEPHFAKLAKKRLAFHLAEISAIKWKNGQYSAAAKQFWQALIKGDKIRHLLSIVKKVSLNTVN